MNLWIPLLGVVIAFWLFACHMEVRNHRRLSRAEAAEKKRCDEQSESQKQVVIGAGHHGVAL